MHSRVTEAPKKRCSCFLLRKLTRRVTQAYDAALAEVERLKDKLHEENVYLRHKTKAVSGHHRIIGQSQAIRRVLNQVDQVAPTDSTVLLFGETGNGK